MPKVLDTAKRVTDPVLLSHLAKIGIPDDEVEFTQDYGKRIKGVSSPYMKRYRHLNSNKQFAVFSGLPMVDCDGVKCEPQWIKTGNTYHIKNNVFSALVNDAPGRVTLTCKNDQPDGIRKKNDKVVFIPQLFVGGIEVSRPQTVLLPIDPLNPNYPQNTLEWDYGTIKRWIRTVEGRYHGYWLRPVDFNQPMSVVYNQTGDFKLKLSQLWKVNDDVEEVPTSITQPQFLFRIVYQGTEYYLISDSSTFYPDANPETTSVDGHVGDDSYVATGTTWATLIAAAGNDANDSLASDEIIDMAGFTSSNTYKWLYRSLYLFDSSALPNTATVTAATLSIYGSAGTEDGLSATPNVNIYTSTPASNTALATGDFTQIGSTAQSTAIAYGSWSGAGYNDFALNDMTQISLTGVSKFGARNANYDVAASAPPWVSGARSRIFGYFSEQGDGYKPKLVVTYTVTVNTTATPITVVLLADERIPYYNRGFIPVQRIAGVNKQVSYLDRAYNAALAALRVNRYSPTSTQGSIRMPVKLSLISSSFDSNMAKTISGSTSTLNVSHFTPNYDKGFIPSSESLNLSVKESYLGKTFGTLLSSLNTTLQSPTVNPGFIRYPGTLSLFSSLLTGNLAMTINGNTAAMRLNQYTLNYDKGFIPSSIVIRTNFKSPFTARGFIPATLKLQIDEQISQISKTLGIPLVSLSISRMTHSSGMGIFIPSSIVLVTSNTTSTLRKDFIPVLTSLKTNTYQAKLNRNNIISTIIALVIDRNTGNLQFTSNIGEADLILIPITPRTLWSLPPVGKTGRYGLAPIESYFTRRD